MRSKIILTIFLMILMVSCRVTPLLGPTPTPPPGWRSLVSDLLVDDNAFPEGWARIRDLPKESLTDPTINHVYRSWWGQAQGEGKADQAIWRAYTIGDAVKKYTELRQQSLLLPNYTPSPWDFYIKFKPPPEINFRSQIADEFYLACGWLYGAQCHVIARYRNYVTYMSLDLEAEYEEHINHGLTYSEIEAVVRAMDTKFAEALEEFSTPSP